MFIQPMSSYIRPFYILVFPKPKYGYINSIRALVLREKGIWLRKWKKRLGFVFMGTVLRLKGEVTGSFHQPFWGIPMVCFLPDFFLFMFPGVMDSHLKWGLNYCTPIYWSARNFLYGFLPLFRRFFHVIFGVLFCG